MTRRTGRMVDFRPPSKSQSSCAPGGFPQEAESIVRAALEANRQSTSDGTTTRGKNLHRQASEQTGRRLVPERFTRCAATVRDPVILFQPGLPQIRAEAL